MPREADFGGALRYVRQTRQQSQEDLAAVSGRTYVSSLERNLQSPTLAKVGTFADALQVHPLTLLALCYIRPRTTAAVQRMLREVERELNEIEARHREDRAG